MKRIITLLLILLVGCSVSAVPLDDSQATKEGVQTTVDAMNQFAIDFYKTQTGNIFFSPFSISTAVAMVYEGARGNTSKEIQNVFQFPDDIVRQSSYARIQNILNTPNKYTLESANALFTDENFPFEEDYLDLVSQYYYAEIQAVNFKEDQTDKINSWGAKATRNKIKNIVKKGDLTSDTKLALLNAIYFKGTWENKFDKKLTKERVFRTPSGPVMVDTMVNSEDSFKMGFIEGVHVLEMDYKGDDISMMIIMHENDSIKPIEDMLTVSNLRLWKGMMHEQSMDVYMPKFTYEAEYDLKPILIEMGMPLAFDNESANFSGIGPNLFIQKARHKAFVEVNEEGTEAAAITFLGVGFADAMPQEFRIDHPFIFLIQEKSTGTILFMGKVMDPTAP